MIKSFFILAEDALNFKYIFSVGAFEEQKLQKNVGMLASQEIFSESLTQENHRILILCVKMLYVRIMMLNMTL